MVGKVLWHRNQELQTTTVLLLRMYYRCNLWIMVKGISHLDMQRQQDIISSWIKTALLVYTVRSCLYMQNSWKAYEEHHQCLKKTEILTACCLMEYDLWIARRRNSMYGQMKEQLYNNITSDRNFTSPKSWFLRNPSERGSFGNTQLSITKEKDKKKKKQQYVICKLRMCR